jgi:hypothetical protein
MLRRFSVLIVASMIAVGFSPTLVSAQRTADGHPDLQGFWTNGTATPFQRPADFANKPFFTPAEAAEYERTALERLISVFPEADRTAADLNDIYLETSTLKVADLRTSLIVDPAGGTLPPWLPAAQARADARPRRNYDDPETLNLDERCLMDSAFGSSNAAPPMVPNPFGQNFYQFVQTRSHLMIFTELVHDARIIRMNATHLPSTIHLWLGDSIGRWEGDTLVVDTTNFTSKTHFRGSGERLHVVERFTRSAPDRIDYRVTVDDPETWSVSWAADIPFRPTTEKMFEYACHEGNLAIENFMRGARAEEKGNK